MTTLTLTTRRVTKLMRSLGLKHESVNYNYYQGPLWDRNTFFIDPNDPPLYTLHEVFHWAFANEWQREIPDFALGRNVHAHYGNVPEDKSADAGFEPSWRPGETRAHRDDAGQQEMWSVIAMGVSDLVLFGVGAFKSEIHSTLADFGAWSGEWTTEDNRYIVDVLIEEGLLSESLADEAFNSLEEWRKLDTTNE